MLEVAHSTRKKDSNLVPSAQYNVGRAYFMVSYINVVCVYITLLRGTFVTASHDCKN